MNKMFKISMMMVMMAAAAAGCKKKSSGGGGSSPTPGPSASASPTVRYPGLPSSCQALTNHTHGLCANYQRADLYPEGPNSVPWKFRDALTDAYANIPRGADLWENGDQLKAGKEGDYGRKLSEYLNTKGICAIYVGGVDIQLRTGEEDYNEQIQFLQERTRRTIIYGHYQCEPSDVLFGTQPGWACPLPAIPEENCRNPQNNYYGDAYDMIRTLIEQERAKPSSDLVDFTSPTGWEYGYRLKDDGVSFLWKAAQMAHDRGYCVTYDNWKSMKIRKNNVAETISVMSHWDPPANKPELAAKCRADGINNTCESTIVKVEDTCTATPQ